VIRKKERNAVLSTSCSRCLTVFPKRGRFQPEIDKMENKVTLNQNPIFVKKLEVSFRSRWNLETLFLLRDVSGRG